MSSLSCNPKIGVYWFKLSTCILFLCLPTYIFHICYKYFTSNVSSNSVTFLLHSCADLSILDFLSILTRFSYIAFRPLLAKVF